MLRQHLDIESRVDRMKNFLHVISSCDLIEVLSFLDGVYLFLIGVDRDVDTFKQYLSSLTPPLLMDYGRLLSPINPAIYSFLSETDNKKKAHLLSSICQFLRFLRKLEFQDIGLEYQAMEGYKETEQELEAFKDYDDDMLNSLSVIISRWFVDFQIGNLRPVNGPGSVAEGPLTIEAKFQAMKVDKIIEILLRSGDDPDSYKDYFPLQPDTGLERVSRTIFVPKTFTKLRTISMEPATLQYLQQGVMFELYQFIADHPYLGVRIKLSDQCQNQYLAQDGSKRHNYGTIDLSHASDSVSWYLVKRMFSSVPRLYRWLIGTRSHSTILPSGERLLLNKYAPMGSALCFPIQCIIFAAVVEHALDNVTKLNRNQHDFYSVYGDDIVLPTAIYDESVRILQAIGFTVNTSKSYNEGEYRESCGKEYYAGVDISPIYYRIPFYRNRVSPAAYGSLCSCANNAWLHNLPLYRRFTIEKVLSCGRRPGPYFSRTPHTSPFIYSSCPTNFHVKSRWNKNYQVRDGKFTVVMSKQRASELADDTIRYHCRLVEMARRRITPNNHLDERDASIAVSGQVEFFGSTYLPTTAYVSTNKVDAYDW